jgi:hypothetical protein
MYGSLSMYSFGSKKNLLPDRGNFIFVTKRSSLILEKKIRFIKNNYRTKEAFLKVFSNATKNFILSKNKKCLSRYKSIPRSKVNLIESSCQKEMKLFKVSSLAKLLVDLVHSLGV